MAGKVHVDNSRMTYYSAINGQGAVAKLTDSVVNFDVQPLSAPLDGWGRVSLHVAVQNCITTEGFNPVSRVITFEDWRFWQTIKDRYEKEESWAIFFVCVILTVIYLVKKGRVKPLLNLMNFPE